MLQKIKVGVLITMLCASSVFAARPFSVEDAGVVEEGFETEISYSGNTAGDSLAHETGFVLNFAVINNLHLGIEKRFTTAIVKGAPDHNWGNGDTVVAAKYALPNDQSLKLSVKGTDGDEENGFGEEYIEYGVLYAKENQFGNTTLYSNLGYNVYDHHEWYSDEVKNNWFLGFGILHPIANNLDLCLETNKTVVQGNYLDNLDGYVNGMIGLVWTINDIPVDFSYTLIPDSKDYNYNLGVTIGF